MSPQQNSNLKLPKYFHNYSHHLLIILLLIIPQMSHLLTVIPPVCSIIFFLVSYMTRTKLTQKLKKITLCSTFINSLLICDFKYHFGDFLHPLWACKIEPEAISYSLLRCYLLETEWTAVLNDIKKLMNIS